MLDRYNDHHGISVTCLMQVLLIIFGWVLTCLRLKMLGYPDDNKYFVYSDWSKFVRHWGMLLLLVPAFWGCIGLWLDASLSQNASKWAIFSAGTLISVVLLVVLYHSAIHPGYHRLHWLR